MSDTKAIEKLSDLTVDKLGEICEQENVTVRKVCQLLYDGMNADIVKLDNEGKEHSRIPDMPTRHKYMTSAMEILKLVKKDVPTTNVINVATLNYNEGKIDRLQEAIAEERRLRGLISADATHRGKVITIEATTVELSNG